MRSIKEFVSSDIEIQKSKFICCFIPVSNEEDVSKALLDIRILYPGGNHYCFAYILGDTGLIQRASDDKEPSKTAGIPILEILKKNDLTNLIAIVIRHFGGTKLGASGLIRAYAKVTKLCVEKATLTYKNTFYHCKVQIDYLYVGLLENKLRELTEMLEINYLKSVEYHFNINADQFSFLEEQISKDTSYLSKIEILNTFTKYL
ncbi:MAG: YigZ family protein [Firmicutes bacterium]|nr:YigZ family protein [Bacillota bacterium]